MTTNANLLPGTLIEYKSAHSIEKAWVCERPVPGYTEGMVKIRVKGETGINMDREFDIFVKARGRAKVLEAPERDEAATTVDDVLDQLAGAGRNSREVERELDAAAAVRNSRAGSHAECYATGAHDKSREGRAGCRKLRSLRNA